MPNHVSAEKRDRQNVRRRLVNRRNRSVVRTAIKKFRAALAEKSIESVKSLLPETVAAIDKAVQKNVIHRNAAARYKSRLTAHANELMAAAK